MTPEQRAAFAVLADVILPAGDGMPAPSEVDVAGRWLDRVLRVRPDLALHIERVVTDTELKPPADALEQLTSQDPAGFQALLAAVTGAYYMSPKVRRRLGYPGQRPRPAYLDEADWDLRDGLLDPVVARGPIYRLVPRTLS